MEEQDKPVSMDAKIMMIWIVFVSLFVYSWRVQLNFELDEIDNFSPQASTDDGAAVETSQTAMYSFTSSAFYLLFILAKILFLFLVIVIGHYIIFTVFVQKFMSFLIITKIAETDMNMNYVFEEVFTLKVMLYLCLSAVVSSLFTLVYVKIMVFKQDHSNTSKLKGHARVIYILSVITFSICSGMLFKFM
jgi:hypothetical protein